ncbi:DNA polymerase I [Oribacterium sp. WCC10]|nr:DNA polymerase I [Oribacterium sp. WCC10]SFG07293.1 DNA polymerase I [Oribacterium sp. WCC10]
MSDKLLLIDGHSIMSRAFYGIPELTNSQGLHTNAVYGFLNILFKVLDEEQADHLAVAFDVHEPTFRHKMFEGYKGTRKPMPSELHEQIPVIQEVLTAMHIPLLKMGGYEADDLLGTVAKRAQAYGADVTIVSGDRDLLQLSDEHIKIYLPKTSKGVTTAETYYPEDVKNEWGVTPLEFIDLKALMGDTSDNIPGVAGLGPKSAEWIIQKYHNIEAAHEAALSGDPEFKVPRKPKAAEMLLDEWESAQMSKTLATINIDSPIDFSYDDAKVSDMFNEEAFELIKNLELKSLIKRFDVTSLDMTAKESIDLGKIKDVTDPYMAKIAFKDAASEGSAGFFIVKKEGVTENQTGQMEMMLADPDADDANADSVGNADETELYFALSGERYYRFHGFDWSNELKELSVKDGVKLYTINLKQQLYECEFTPDSHIYDLALAAYVVNPLKDTYTYEDIARDFVSLTLPSEKELRDRFKAEKAAGKGSGRKGTGSSSESGEKTDNAALGSKSAETVEEIMAAYTAIISRDAADSVMEKLSELSEMELYRDIEMPLIYTLYYMQKEGIRVDKEALLRFGEELRTGIDELQAKIYEQAGEEFNINSPKQLGEILFEKLGLKGGKKTKSGYSTAADVLDKLAEDNRIVRDIQEYRTLSKLNSTYAEGLLGFIREDGRIHGEFNQMVTATGRISSTNPNLQNIPIRTELGRRFRKVFVPKDGCIFIDADYSQVELRILASLSGDPKLIAAYKDARDIHAVTASQVFHIPLEEVTDQQRRNAKAVNFGIVYGISAFGLSEGLSISRAEAKEYIERYFETYPDVKKYLDGEVEFARKNGYIKTVFGRRRPVPDINASNFMRRSFSERVAMNSPIQGSAADIMKKAMNDVDRALREGGYKARIVVQVHDELLIEAPLEEKDQVKALLIEKMQNAVDLQVLLVADASVGTNWDEAH